MKRGWNALRHTKELFSRSCSSTASRGQSTPVTAPGTPFSGFPINHRLSWGDGGPAASFRNYLPQQTTWLAAAVGSIGLGMGGIAIAAADQLPVSHIQKYFQGNAKESNPSTTSNAAMFPPPSTSRAPVILGPHFIADAAATAAPAVVNITVSKDGLPVPQDHSGTGFIYSANGCILTNAHVIADALPSSDQANANSSNATSCSNSSRGSSSSTSSTASNSSSKPITVALQDGRIFQGSVVMFDRISDLAVIQITSSQPLPVVKLGTSKGLRAGEWVLALGSPLHLQNSVTAGIISCVDRKAADLGLARVRTEYIQTDAAINKGNSGGPLVNLQGEVIGLACFKALSADGVSFAIPIDTAKDVIQQLQQRGRVIRPYIGIKMLQLNEHNAAQMRQKDAHFPEVNQGILVPHVAAGSPACKCGLREGDVITGFAGQSSNLSTNHLIQCLSQHIDTMMDLSVLRPEKGTVKLQVKVSEALQ